MFLAAPRDSQTQGKHARARGEFDEAPLKWAPSTMVVRQAASESERVINENLIITSAAATGAEQQTASRLGLGDAENSRSVVTSGDTESLYEVPEHGEVR